MTREEYLKHGLEIGLLKFSEYLELTKPLKFPEDLEKAAEDYRRNSYNASLIPPTDGPTPDYGYNVIDTFKAGAKGDRAKMMEKAVGGRYMKADGKVYVESWPLDIDPDSVKAGDEVRLIVIPEESEKVK